MQYVGNYEGLPLDTWDGNSEVKFYSNFDKQYVLDKENRVWKEMAWEGLSNFSAGVIWSDDVSIYAFPTYSPYVLVKVPLAYLMKYLEKTGEKIVYSKGLPQYFVTDIAENDVATRIGIDDRKLLLFDNFACYKDQQYSFLLTCMFCLCYNL